MSNSAETGTVTTPAEVNPLLKRTPWQRFWKNFARNWQLHLIVLLPMIYIVLFEYLPFYGLQIAFKDFNSRDGIWGSPWVGLDHFIRFFKDYKWSRYVLNTLKISLYQIFLTFPVPIIFALVLHINENKILKKITQNVSYIPHFISLVVMIGMLNNLLDPVVGMLGAFSKNFGWDIPNVLLDPDAFIHLYAWSGTWQNMGWSAIIYVAALSAVPQERHEAAMLDGASRLHRVWYVDLPTIMPTITMMFIMAFGGVLSVGYDKIFLMQNNVNLEVSEVISTYVYKQGIGRSQLDYATAISLMNSLINMSMMTLMNYIVKFLGDEDTQGLF